MKKNLNIWVLVGLCYLMSDEFFKRIWGILVVICLVVIISEELKHFCTWSWVLDPDFRSSARWWKQCSTAFLAACCLAELCHPIPECTVAALCKRLFYSILSSTSLRSNSAGCLRVRAHRSDEAGIIGEVRTSTVGSSAIRLSLWDPGRAACPCLVFGGSRGVRVGVRGRGIYIFIFRRRIYE